MKKECFVFCILLINFVTAQNPIEANVPITTKSTAYGLASLSILDPYVSPLVYGGLGFRYSSDAKRFINPDIPKFSYQLQSSTIISLNLNPTSTSSMLYLGTEYGLGGYYHIKPLSDMQLLLGGVWDVNVGLKSVSRNVNNPYSLDIATNLNVSVIARYDIYTEIRRYRVHWLLQSPVIGGMFVPRAGASYYEIFSLGNSSETVHFSALHNKRGLRQLISVEVPFRRSMWNFGISSLNLKYTANDMVFVMKEASLVVGTTFDFASFKGSSRKAPKNFISTNE
jgi:hypothetical protein